MADAANEDVTRDDLMRMAADIVAAYVTKNKLDAESIPEVINTVYGTLVSLSSISMDAADKAKPFVPIRKSVTPEYIICLEDGKKLKMLKRHLRTTFGLTPEEYRAKWNLPTDYPMVAPNYAKKRSEFAKKIGLGRKAG